jgi:hypothetical protein
MASLPPLNFIKPSDAVQRVRDRFECTEQEAVEFIRDKWRADPTILRWDGDGPPHGDIDFSKIDWVAGAMVIPGECWQEPRVNLGYAAAKFRLISGGPSQRHQPWHVSSDKRCPFTIDRQQLAGILDERPAAPIDRGQLETKTAAANETNPRPSIQNKKKGNEGPKSRFALLADLEYTLTKGSLATGPIPSETRTIWIMVCRDAGYQAGAEPRGWKSAETLSRHGGKRIDEERRARAGKS